MPKNGYLTPSQFSKIMTKPRSKSETWSKTALTYADEIVLQLLGIESDDISAPALDWGNTWEIIARERYERDNFTDVPEINESIHHPDFAFVCGTPDGLVGDAGILEIKCPYASKNHLANLRTGAQIDDYKWQINGYLWITSREWCDFVSYDNRFPASMQIAQHRVERDDALIAELESTIVRFWDLIQSDPLLKR
jgi:predicted phage-related endonuclease